MRTRTALFTAALAAATAVTALPARAAGPGVWAATLEATQGADKLSAFADGTFYAQYLDSYARSKDYGRTWQVMPKPPRQYLGSPGIRFATPQVGWSVAGGGAGLSDDLLDPEAFADEIKRCGGLTPLHRTTDGGTTWRAVCVPNTAVNSDPQFLPGVSPLAVGRDGRTITLAGSESRLRDEQQDCGETADAIYSTRDAGATWARAALPKGWVAGFRSQVFDSSTYLHLAYYFEEGACESATVGLFVSRDAGRSFKKMLVCRVQPTCTSVAMLTRSHLIVGRTDGSTMVSRDGGSTWRRGQKLFDPSYQPAIDSGQMSPYILWAQALSFVDAKHGFASTRGSGTWRTSNGGVSWVQEKSHECAYLIWGIGEIAAGTSARAITGGPHLISAREEAVTDDRRVEGCRAPQPGMTGIAAIPGTPLLTDGTLVARPRG